VLIERNTTIPVEKKEVFSTAADSQTAVTVSVFQGERKMARDNRLLGQFNLDGIPPAPRGVPQIEVSFDIDVNGILKVSAKDIATQKVQTVSIEKSSGLSEADIEKMRSDAESHAEEDLRKRKLAEARNHASRLVYETEKLTKEHADKLDSGSKSAIDSAIERVNKAAAGEDAGAIDSAVKDLEQATHALSKHMYEAAAKAGGSAQAQPGNGQPEEAGHAGDNVIDAEFEKT
jgi:molecular chaperone DnaK